jgi:hypothetical protein
MLHKSSYMLGFHLEATDGGIGHVDDFLVDESWHIRYLVVDTSNWPGGKAVIIPSSAVDRVDSPNKKIFLKLASAAVQNSASVDTADIPVIETLGFTIL